MKRFISYIIVNILLIAALVAFMVSCKPAQPIVEKTITTEVYKRQIDSLQKLIISKAINDKLVINVPQSNTGNKNTDSIVNAKIAEILSKLNYQKNSGDNSFAMLYDEFKKQLLISAKVAETRSDNTKVKEKNTTDKNTDNTKPVYIKKPYSKPEIAAFVIAGLTVLGLFVKGVLFVRKRLTIFNS